MSIPKILNFSDYNRYPADENPTTDADMQDYMGNQNSVLKNIVSTYLWQPQTNYVVNQEVHSPTMPAGYRAICVTAGTSGTTEPSWSGSTLAYTDGTVTWNIVSFYSGKVNVSDYNTAMALKAPLTSPAFLTSATLDGKNLESVEDSGNNYIRYSNGVQICFYYVSNGTHITFTKPFKTGTVPSAVCTANFANINSSGIGCVNLNAAEVKVFYSGESAFDGISVVVIGRWK